MWTLGGFGASLVGMVACLAVARLKIYNMSETPDIPSRMGLGWALSAYLVLIVIVSAGVMIPALKSFLGQVRLSIPFPEITSRTGWVVRNNFV